MKKLMNVTLLLYIFFSASAVFADQSISNVGIRLFSVDFPSTNSEIRGLIWHPTPNKPEKVKLGPFELNVARNATIKNGKFGLIVISHGSRGSHLGHRDTAIYLAERDYIVISLLHPKNNYMDDSAGRTVENWINRPRHVSKVLDFILDEGELKEFIDQDAIAIIGHSAGGYTALSLAGGVPDTANIGRHCREHDDDTEFCGGHPFVSKIKAVFSASKSSESNIIKNTHDHRIKAAVLLAPLGVPFKDKPSLFHVNVPIRIYRAEKDDVLRYPYHAESIRQKLNIRPEYIVVENAGHYSFLSPFPESIRKSVGVVAEDPDGFNRTEFHSTMNREIFEFLSKSLTL